ncbi:MAG: PAS domain S-box protein [Candidatus Heimdallarchaeaceae archaeon]
MLPIKSNENEDFRLLQDTFDVLFQNSPDMILLTDLEGNIFDANIQALRYFGFTLRKIQGKNFMDFIKDKKAFKALMEKTLNERKDLRRIPVLTKKKGIISFDISASIVGDDNKKFIVFICRDVQNIVESNAQRQFIYDLFQHDLLNKLHAEIGFIDFYSKIISMYPNVPSSANQMIEKVRDLTVRSIYLIQNINIMLMLQDYHALSNQNIEDSINHAVRYLKSFFSKRVQIEIIRLSNFYVAGDDYFYRIFVNLIINMLERTSNKVEVEITVEEPSIDKDSAIIILHFENATLRDEEKREILAYNQLSIKKLDIIVTRTLLERYHLKLRLEDIRRRGEVVGTRMLLSVPVARAAN